MLQCSMVSAPGTVPCAACLRVKVGSLECRFSDRMDCSLVARPGRLVLACIAALPAQCHYALREPKKGVFEGFPESGWQRQVTDR